MNLDQFALGWFAGVSDAVTQVGASHYVTVKQATVRFAFPSYAATYKWLVRNRHKIQPLKRGRTVLYAVEDIEKVMRERTR